MPVRFSNSLYVRLAKLEDRHDPVATRLLSADLTTNDFADHVTQRGELFTYWPSSKRNPDGSRMTQPVNDDGSWQREGRQESRPSRLARKLLTEAGLAGLSDKDFETFHNRVTGINNDSIGTWEIVEGDRIRELYHWSVYSPHSASLNASCMRYDECQSYLSLYTENPSVCQMLVLFDDDQKVKGRALLWHTYHGVVMDRVYANDSVVEAFHAYAHNLNWRYRTFNTYEDETFFTNPDGFEQELQTFVQLTNAQQTFYPYCDTFKHLDLSTNRLYNHLTAANPQTTYRLQMTDGNHGYSFPICHHCGNRHNSWSDNLCADCRKNFFYCDVCGVYQPNDTKRVFNSPGNHYDGRVLCESCLSMVKSCSGCNQQIFPGRHNWSTRFTGHDYYCDQCAGQYLRCHDCHCFGPDVVPRIGELRSSEWGICATCNHHNSLVQCPTCHWPQRQNLFHAHVLACAGTHQQPASTPSDNDDIQF